MAALGLSVAVFLFWGIVGLGLIATLRSRRHLLQNLLLAPTVGMAATLSATFMLHQVGVPVGRSGPVISTVLVVATIVSLSLRRPLIPLRQVLPLGAMLCIATMLIGWPMLYAGFDWLSVANDDQSNVAILATRFLSHGAFEVPTVDELESGRDYSLFYWFFEVATPRPGTALTLAWVMSLTGLNGQQATMPAMLAAHLVSITSTCALVCTSSRLRTAALLSCWMIVLSPLHMYGTLLQLLPQVTGIGLLASCAVLLTQRQGRIQLRTALGHGVLLALVGAALLLTYPEVSPYLGIGFALYLGFRMLRRRFPEVQLAPVLGIAAFVCVLIINFYLQHIVAFLALQARVGLTTVNAGDSLDSLFPHFLVPSGLAALWGLQALGALSSEPWLSVTIFLGALLLAGAFCAALLVTWHGHPVAPVFLAMFIVGGRMWVQGFDYGLFKLAMFSQPFMLGTVCVALAGSIIPRRRAVDEAASHQCVLQKRKSQRGLAIGSISVRSLRNLRALRLAPIIFVSLLGIPAYSAYMDAAVYMQLSGGAVPITALQRASAMPAPMSSEFERLLASYRPEHVSLDTTVISLAKLQSMLLKDVPSTFLSRDVLRSRYVFQLVYWRGFEGSLVTAGEMLLDSLDSRLLNLQFDLHATDGQLRMNPFALSTVGQQSTTSGDCDVLIMTPVQTSIFNQRRLTPTNGSDFTAVSCEEIRDHLIFTHSDLGQHYYLGRTRSVAMFQAEFDPMISDGRMAAVGRHLLFQALNPSPSVRLSLSMTSTLRSDGENRLPPAAAIGSDRQPFPILGRGSARVFSPPLAPQPLANRSFVAIDMGEDARRFPEAREGLMRLYGGNVALDLRWAVGFGRDVSLVSEDEYRRLNPPTSVADFPAALADPNLEYSGMYEDGWISEEAFFGLSQPFELAEVVARGTVPMIDQPSFATEVRLLVDGQEVARQTVRPGDFEIRGRVPVGGGRLRVELRFSDFQRLRAPDRRPVAARMHFVGFEAAAAMSAPEKISDFPADVENPDLRATGLAADGWIAEVTSLDLTQTTASVPFMVRGMVPLIDNPEFTTELSVLVDRQEVATQTLGLGDFEVQAAVPGGPGLRTIELRFSATQQIPAPDGRRVGARVQLIGFETRAVAPGSPVLAGPQVVKDLPEDVENPNVQANGLATDGWLADVASVFLVQPGPSVPLAVRGMVPLIDDPGFTTELSVRVGGQEVARQTLGLGDFELQAAVPGGPARRTVELRFSATQQIPAPDGRRVGARVQLIGFEVGASATGQR